MNSISFPVAYLGLAKMAIIPDMSQFLESDKASGRPAYYKKNTSYIIIQFCYNGAGAVIQSSTFFINKPNSTQFSIYTCVHLSSLY